MLRINCNNFEMLGSPYSPLSNDLPSNSSLPNLCFLAKISIHLLITPPTIPFHRVVPLFPYVWSVLALLTSSFFLFDWSKINNLQSKSQNFELFLVILVNEISICFIHSLLFKIVWWAKTKLFIQSHICRLIHYFLNTIIRHIQMVYAPCRGCPKHLGEYKGSSSTYTTGRGNLKKDKSELRVRGSKLMKATTTDCQNIA